MFEMNDPIRKLAKALAENADTEGYGGDGVTAKIWLDDKQITGGGWYGSEAEEDLINKIIEWAQE